MLYWAGGRGSKRIMRGGITLESTNSLAATIDIEKSLKVLLGLLTLRGDSATLVFRSSVALLSADVAELQ